MQYTWLNKQNNENLIIFFTGWSFDETPFKFLKCENFDVLFIYDYTKCSLDKIANRVNYKHKYLIAWSMGVYAAYKFKNLFYDFDKKIAINGTPFPVDDEFGIPKKPFLLTLRHAKTGLEGKFYQNIFDNFIEYERYIQTPVKRTIENRVEELNELYKLIQSDNIIYDHFYTYAFVSLRDKIIPSKNQIKFWTKFNTPIKQLESGHFPYYNFKSWKELL